MPRYAKDLEHEGIELYYDGKPGENTIARLKEHGWRWNPKKNCWYAKNTEENVKFATKECAKKMSSKFLNKREEPKPKKQKNEKTKEQPTTDKSDGFEFETSETNQPTIVKDTSSQTLQKQLNTQELDKKNAKNNCENISLDNKVSLAESMSDNKNTPVSPDDSGVTKPEIKQKNVTEKAVKTAVKKQEEKPVFEVAQNYVEFAQNTPQGVTVIKITKAQDNTYRISSKNGLIMCANCKHHISIRSPKCIFCGTGLGKTLDAYFKLQHKKKDAEDEKQSTKDQEIFKKQQIELFEENHEIFFSREHRKYLMDLKINDFKTVVKRSEHIIQNKASLPYLSQDNWMRLMRLTEERFFEEIEKIKK